MLLVAWLNHHVQANLKHVEALLKNSLVGLLHHSYSSGQKKVLIPFRHYEHTKLITVKVSNSFQFCSVILLLRHWSMYMSIWGAIWSEVSTPRLPENYTKETVTTRTTAPEKTTVAMKATADVWRQYIPRTKSNKSSRTIHRDIGFQRSPSWFDGRNCLPLGVGFASSYFGTEHLSRPTENYVVTTLVYMYKYGNTHM